MKETETETGVFFIRFSFTSFMLNFNFHKISKKNVIQKFKKMNDEKLKMRLRKYFLHFQVIFSNTKLNIKKTVGVL